ncbi:MAG: glycerol dehydratase reactivase beta/small subunit family protein [Defluviitaleaceae bacterium]|nr:glycerol dehydratase reactivase beta/small subunit family protein [Defluviitaleaceae bacterium]
MKKIAAVIYAEEPDSSVLAEILAGLEEEGIPGEVVVPEAVTGGGSDIPVTLAKAAASESVFDCGIGICGGTAALYAGGAAIMEPKAASPRIVGKNAALFIKKERFDMA